MSVQGYILRDGGFLGAEVYGTDRMICPRHHGPLKRVASVSSWSPHYCCRFCPEVYVLMGHDVMRCETPDICVARPLRFLDRRREKRPPMQAGPMGRGLL